MVPAFVGLGAPYWDPDARGAIFGLTLGATGAHLARAALVAVAYLTRDLLDAVAKDAAAKPTAIRIDGGMSANDWFCQFLADILDVPVQRSMNLETTALGAAFLAGLATGLWSDTDAIARTWRERDCFKPDMASERRGALVAGWKAAIRRTLTSSR